MTLDSPTLACAGGIVAFACSLFILTSGLGGARNWSVPCWAVAYLGRSIRLLYLAVDYTPVAVASTLLLDLAAFAMWAGALFFNGGSFFQRRTFIALVAGLGLLIYASGISSALASALGVAGSGFLYAATAFEFWLGREEKLRGRALMILILAVHSICVFIVATQHFAIALGRYLPDIWYQTVHLQGFVFSVGSAICLIAMLKERSEATHRVAAFSDPLTELLNRRGFLDRAQRMLERSGFDQKQVALLAFDLDRFKSINDRFGHPAGDHVLQLFAETLTFMLRPTDVIGRLGGEEFGAALCECDAQTAFIIAERIRNSFREKARIVNGRNMNVTVSIGCSLARHGETNLDHLMSRADRALYSAKHQGRDRVVLADETDHLTEKNASSSRDERLSARRR